MRVSVNFNSHQCYFLPEIGAFGILVFSFSTIKCELIKKLPNINWVNTETFPYWQLKGWNVELSVLSCSLRWAIVAHEPLVFILVAYLRWKVTKLNNGVRVKTITPPECSFFWENVSVFSFCVIINPSFSRRHEIGMVLAVLTSSNSLLKLHIFGNYLQTNWPIEMI